mgnify:CR=1 FL=1
MEDIKRKCNPTVDLSKFTSNKKILSKVVALGWLGTTNFVTKLCSIKNFIKLKKKNLNVDMEEYGFSKIYCGH